MEVLERYSKLKRVDTWKKGIRPGVFYFYCSLLMGRLWSALCEAAKAKKKKNPQAYTSNSQSYWLKNGSMIIADKK